MLSDFSYYFTDANCLSALFHIGAKNFYEEVAFIIWRKKKSKTDRGRNFGNTVNSQIQVQLWDNYNLIVSFLGVLKLHPQHKVKYPK